MFGLSKKSEIRLKTAFLAASLGFFLLDQATKIWARESLRFNDSVTVVPNFLHFIYAENTGVAFSQLSGGGETGRWLLSALAGIAALAVLYYLWRTPETEKLILSALAERGITRRSIWRMFGFAPEQDF
jgi:signal peptidase II